MCIRDSIHTFILGGPKIARILFPLPDKFQYSRICRAVQEADCKMCIRDRAKAFLIALSHLPGAVELTANLPKSGDTP